MLLESEKKYIETIPLDKIVMIFPFSPKATKLADDIIQKVKEVCPDLRVIYMGASGLGISGQRDLDIYALSDPKNFPKHLSKLIKLFGKPKRQKENSIDWEFRQDGYEVEFYLTNPKSPSMKRQIAVFEILNNNKKLREEYEILKENMNGKSFRDYQRKKYEFYHKILK